MLMPLHGECNQVNEKLLTIDEAAERLNVKVSRIRTLLFQEDLPRIKIGRLVRIAESDLEDYIAKQRVAS